MKKVLFAVISFLMTLDLCSQASHTAAPAPATRQLTAADWQADLRHLQQTVHKDYSFLFKKITRADWDARVEKLYKDIPSMNEYEIMGGFSQVVSSFGYGHTDIAWSASPVKYHMAPVNFYWFSDGIYAEGADKQYAGLVGARLLKVEGMPVKEVLKAIKPLMPAENEQYFKAYSLDFLCIPEALLARRIIKKLKPSVTFTFEKDGKTFEQTVTAVDAFRFPRTYGFTSPGSGWTSMKTGDVTPHYLKNLDRIYYYEYIPESKTVYVRHSQIQDDPKEDIPAFYKRVFEFIEQNDVEKLVLDVRLNGGGNNYKNKPIIAYKLHHPSGIQEIARGIS